MRYVRTSLLNPQGKWQKYPMDQSFHTLQYTPLRTIIAQGKVIV